MLVSAGWELKGLRYTDLLLVALENIGCYVLRKGQNSDVRSVILSQTDQAVKAVFSWEGRRKGVASQ